MAQQERAALWTVRLEDDLLTLLGNEPGKWSTDEDISKRINEDLVEVTKKLHKLSNDGRIEHHLVTLNLSEHCIFRMGPKFEEG